MLKPQESLISDWPEVIGAW